VVNVVRTVVALLGALLLVGALVELVGVDEGAAPSVEVAAMPAPPATTDPPAIFEIDDSELAERGQGPFLTR